MKLDEDHQALPHRQSGQIPARGLRSGRHLRPRHREGGGQGDARRRAPSDSRRLQETALRRRTAGRCWSCSRRMDAAGKDGAIKHVMSGLNPQGCEVHSFKAPSDEELDHDFLWRTASALPRARPHRHLQPLLLRGGAGGARAPRDAGDASACRRSSSARTSGTSASRTSAPSSATSRATARASSSSSCTSRRRSSASASSRGSRSRPSAGSSRWATSPSASCGTSTCTPTRTAIRATSRRRGAVVRRAGGPQMVRAARRRGGDGRRDGRLAARISPRWRARR